MFKNIRLEISKSLSDSLSARYEKEKLSPVAINLNHVQEFIEYILKNFDPSSKQFENLKNQKKKPLSKMNINNINLNNLVKSLTQYLGALLFFVWVDLLVSLLGSPFLTPPKEPVKVFTKSFKSILFISMLEKAFFVDLLDFQIALN